MTCCDFWGGNCTTSPKGSSTKWKSKVSKKEYCTMATKYEENGTPGRDSVWPTEVERHLESAARCQGRRRVRPRQRQRPVQPAQPVCGPRPGGGRPGDAAARPPGRRRGRGPGEGLRHRAAGRTVAERCGVAESGIGNECPPPRLLRGQHRGRGRFGGRGARPGGGQGGRLPRRTPGPGSCATCPPSRHRPC